jgi:hypothetical protein
MNHKFDVDLVVLQSNLSVLTILQIESMDGYMLYSKYVVTLIVTLLIIVHLFGDLLMSVRMIITLMWLVNVVMTINLM